MYLCKFCPKEYEKILSLRNHERCCKFNPNRINSKFCELNKNHPADRKKQGKIWSERYAQGEIKKVPGIAATPDKEIERRRKISEKAKLNNGGHRHGSGRGKKGWYKGFFCDSSYELAYLIYCLEHDISITRNTEKLQYVWENKIRNYIPDFIVDGKLVEIKGYSTKQWKAKISQHPDIVVLYEKDLSHVFKYVHDKYGKDFIKLYE